MPLSMSTIALLAWVVTVKTASILLAVCVRDLAVIWAAPTLQCYTEPKGKMEEERKRERESKKGGEIGKLGDVGLMTEE